MTRALQLAGWSLFAVLACGVVHTMVHAQEAEEAEKAREIVDVMHEAHLAPEGGTSLRDRVLSGKATAKERNQLLDIYISLTENEPPRGKLEDFQKKTNAVVLAAAKVVVGRKGAEAELRKATTCAACHKDHKPPQQ